MQRLPEPELMDDPAGADAYADADFSESDTAFVADFVRRYGEPAGDIVDLGCGPGNIAFELARRQAPGRPLALLAVDGSAAMLARARARLATAPAPITLLLAQLPSSAVPDRAFNVVISNSLLHHLPDPGVLWREVRRVARPGAAIHIGDLRRPASVAEAAALVARYAPDAPPVLAQDFLASLLAAFEPDEVRAQLVEAGLALEVSCPDDRHLLVSGYAPA